MDVDHFSQYFNKAPVLYIEGRQFPVKVVLFCYQSLYCSYAICTLQQYFSTRVSGPLSSTSNCNGFLPEVTQIYRYLDYYTGVPERIENVLQGFAPVKKKFENYCLTVESMEVCKEKLVSLWICLSTCVLIYICLGSCGFH